MDGHDLPKGGPSDKLRWFRNDLARYVTGGGARRRDLPECLDGAWIRLCPEPTPRTHQPCCSPARTFRPSSSSRRVATEFLNA